MPTTDDAPELEAGTMTCPSGHALVHFVCDICCTCDSCKQSQAVGASMHSCRKCNYDICARCAGEPTEKEGALAKLKGQPSGISEASASSAKKSPGKGTKKKKKKVKSNVGSEGAIKRDDTATSLQERPSLVTRETGISDESASEKPYYSAAQTFGMNSEIEIEPKSASSSCFGCWRRAAPEDDGLFAGPLTENDLEDAKQHMKNKSATQACNKPWPIWKTIPADFRIYGPGVHLYFFFERLFGFIFFVAVIFVLPPLIWFTSGNRIEHSGWTGPSKMVETLAKTTLANLGTFHKLADNSTVSEIKVAGVSYDPKDMAWWCSALDAVACTFVFIWALMLEIRIVPTVLKRHQSASVTPEVFTLFVTGLPRRLEEDHKSYASQLMAHFETLLRAGLSWDNVRNGMRVVSPTDPGFDQRLTFQPKTLRRCGCRICPRRSSNRDKKGRRLGIVEDYYQKELTVTWQDTPALYEIVGKQPPQLRIERREWENQVFQVKTLDELTAIRNTKEFLDGSEFEFLQADLLGNLEACDCNPAEHPENEPLIHDITIVRDTRGELSKQHTKFQAELKKAIVTGKAEQAKGSTMLMSTELGQWSSSEDYQNLDVVGAFVTFSRRKHRDFIFDEYRFSRTRFKDTLLPERLRFKGCAIQIDSADGPTDVFWENLDVPERDRIVRKAIVALCCLVGIAVCVGLFAGAQQATRKASSYGSDIDCVQKPEEVSCQCTAAGVTNVYNDNPPGIYDLCEDWIKYRAASLAISTVATVTVAVTNFIISVLVFKFGEFVKPTSLTDLGQGIMNLTFVMQLLNLGFITVLVNAHFGVSVLGNGFFNLIGNGTFDDVSPDWYVVVGGSILFLMLTNALMPLVGMLTVLIFRLQVRCSDYKKCKSKIELLELYTPPPFMFASRHAEQLTCLFNAIVFSAGMPLLWVFAFISLPIFYWSDKITLACGSLQPPRYSHELLIRMSQWLQSALFWHAAFAIWVYGNSEVPSHKVFDGSGSFLARIGLSALDSDLWSPVFNRACRGTAVPSTLSFLLIVVVSVLRLFEYVFGQAILGSLWELYSASRGYNAHSERSEGESKNDQSRMQKFTDQVVAKATTIRVAAKEAATAAATAAQNAAVSAATAVSNAADKAGDMAYDIVATVTGRSSTRDEGPDPQVSGLDPSALALWTTWGILFHPNSDMHNRILEEPFAGAPVARMEINKICHKYSFIDVWKDEILDTDPSEAYNHPAKKDTAPAPHVVGAAADSSAIGMEEKTLPDGGKTDYAVIGRASATRLVTRPAE